MEVYVDDETKLTLHGLQQHYVKLQESEKNRKLFDLLDLLEFNQVSFQFHFSWLNFFLNRLSYLLGLYHDVQLLISYFKNKLSPLSVSIVECHKRKGK